MMTLGRNLKSIKKFKKKTLIKFIRTKWISAFGVSVIYSIKLLTRLRLYFSHLNEHNFKHNFNDTTNLIGNCGAATETIHYLLRCQLYSVQSVELLNGLYKLDFTLIESSEDQVLTVIFYGSEKFALNVNKEIVRLTISYLKDSEHLPQPLFWPKTIVFIYSFVILLCLIVSAYCKWF